jgi:hypothetical protein
VGTRAREQQEWIVRPLIDAGLSLEQIRRLVFGLAFEDIVSEGRGTLTGPSSLVADLSPEVRVAWGQMITRMLVLEFA